MTAKGKAGRWVRVSEAEWLKGSSPLDRIVTHEYAWQRDVDARDIKMERFYEVWRPAKPHRRAR